MFNLCLYFWYLRYPCQLGMSEQIEEVSQNVIIFNTPNILILVKTQSYYPENLTDS